jgi:hypothetical protein
MSEEVLTLEEMKRRYDGEWVLIEDPQTDEHLRVLSGKVTCHSKDREEVYRCAADTKPRRAAFRFFGTRPEHLVVNV